MRNGIALLLSVSMAAAAGEPWSTPQQTEDCVADMKAFFEGAEVRFPGSPGNLAIEKKVGGVFAASGFKSGEIQFHAPVFRPGKTTLSVEGAGEIRLLPLHPSMMRPGNFRERDFTAKLFYAGRATLDDLDAVKGQDLNGAVALLEFNCGNTWQRLLRFGVKGFIFIASGSYDYLDAFNKVHSTEVAVPRFYVSGEDGARLRGQIQAAGTPLSVRIKAQPSRWEDTLLRDPWVFIPGSDPNLSKEVCLLLAPIDSNCVVPELGESAQAGANLHLLLRLLKEYQAQPPARSVLLAAVNGHTQYFLGERMLAWHLLVPDQEVQAVRNLIVQDIRVQNLLSERYGALAKLLGNPASAAEAKALLIGMRSEVDSSIGKPVTIKQKLVALCKADVNRTKVRQLEEHRRLKTAHMPDGEIQEKLNSFKIERDKFVQVLKLFNKWGDKTEYSDLSGEEKGILLGYVNKIHGHNAQLESLNQQDLKRDEANGKIRDVLEGRGVRWAMILDLTWQNRKLGLSSGDVLRNSKWKREWGARVVEMAQQLPGVKEQGKDNLFADTMTFKGGLPEAYYVPATPAIGMLQAARRTPAFSLTNLFGQWSSTLFTPADSFKSLDKAIVGELSGYVPQFLRALLAADASKLEQPVNSGAWTLQLKTLKFDEFSSSVLPELEVPNSFLMLDSSAPLFRDVIGSYLYLTDVRATGYIYGIKENTRFRKISSTAFQMDENFVDVVHAIDAGDKHETLDSNVVQRNSQTFVMFECTEFPIYWREDPSLISVNPISVADFKPLDTKRETAPRQYGMTGVTRTVGKTFELYGRGPAAIFKQRGQRLKIVTPQNRNLALNILEDDKLNPEGVGYASADEMGPDYFAVVARDMARLNEHRLGKLRGISDDLAKRFLQDGRQALKEADKARLQHDHVGYLQSLYSALGAEVQSYKQIRGITNDMLRAVVFYMALILPFCFFMQKLLFNIVRIEAQIGLFFFLFIVSYLAFRQIHPAFVIAKSPEGILIAFVMGGLGMFVIKILHGRFEGEMQMLFRSYSGRESAEVGYSTVGQKAMLIGVNNMRRRRVRTALTTATIVLVTFTMLSFTSISQSMSPTVVTWSKDVPPYTGLMYHWPSRPMDEATMGAFQELFQGKADVLVRRWMLPPQLENGKSIIPFYVETSAGRSAKVEAALGLPAREDGFIAPVPMIAGRFFQKDDADEVIVPASLAGVLGIDNDNFNSVRIDFAGRSLRIAGILNDERFRMIEDLDRRRILPLKASVAAPTAGAGAAPAGGTAPDQSNLYVETSSLLILPVDTAAKVGAAPYSVSVRFKDPNMSMWSTVVRMLTVAEANFYIGSTERFTAGEAAEAGGAAQGQQMNPGVYYIGAGFRTSVGNLASLIIPLLISGTIILNTMLGSVFERKKEIAVYNAVGLNPNHIGLFFLSEAFVYSVVGSVGGYLIGQGLSMVLIHFGVTGIDLNFSSLKVVYVILFTVAMVLLSTLYPALLATREAVPSGKRKWSFPAHDGQQMQLVFPFIYNPDVVRGVTGYLEEYFARFTEASVGDLIARLVRKTKGRDAQGRDTYALEYEIALAPFDLGVTQRVIFEAAYEDRVQSYRITMTNIRISGQDTNWVTTNKPFLEKLRAYLMHWRNLNASQQKMYGEAIVYAETVAV